MSLFFGTKKEVAISIFKHIFKISRGDFLFFSRKGTMPYHGIKNVLV